MTHTLLWAGRPTQQLVVFLWTLMVAITHVERMETDLGATTAVVARTCVHITLPFVLLSWTVVHTVTAQEDRQAVAVVQALEVGFWTLYVLFVCVCLELKINIGSVLMNVCSTWTSFLKSIV